MKELAVAVVGAGIGGLTAALALARAGHRITLIERRTGFSEVGAGLQVSPNASRILLREGLGAALRRAASEPDQVTIRSVSSGRTLGSVALGGVMREHFQAPYFVVQRTDLQTILLDAVRAQPAVRFAMGRSLQALAQGRGSVDLSLATAAGARESLRADLVVGADGVWSKVRSALGDTRAPVFRAMVAWRATIGREVLPADFSGNETGLWLGPGCHVVHYPVDAGRQLNIVAIEGSTIPVEGWSAPGEREELLRRFEGATPLLRDLLGRPPSWLKWSLFDLPATMMARGRVALLGDAAHPVLPFLAQGAALAIEDAATLTAYLSDAGSDVEAALARYEKRRLARSRRVQRHARLNGRIYHTSGPVAFARNRLLRFLGPTGLTRRYAWLYGDAAG